MSGKYFARVQRFVRYLQVRGIIKSTTKERASPSSLIVEFRDWLLRHRGVVPVTVKRYDGALATLPLIYGRDPRELTVSIVRKDFLARTEGRSSRYRLQYRCALRAYFRFLQFRGECTPELANAIPALRQYKLASLPRYLPPKDVERVIAAFNGTRAVDIRNRAVLLLLARLGLRGGEVARLTLDDVNWREGTVKVCGKGRRDVPLPLPQEVGDAMLDYLHKARPLVPIQQLFICLNAPYRAMTSGVVTQIVTSALVRAGIEDPPTKGANLLRHSAATTMLRGGASLDAVSAMLRHRTLSMTAHYAKVDIDLLSQVAQPWPEKLPC